MIALISLIISPHVVYGDTAGPQPQQANQIAPPPSIAIYDADPNHLWNRLFAVFYLRKIANNTYARTDVGWSMNRLEAPRWVGPDVLDPPLGYHPQFLLDDEPFTNCSALLDEFLNRHGDTLIHDPLKRALLQRDLWAVFDVLAEAGQNSVIPMGAIEFRSTSPAPFSAAQEKHRTILERKLAHVIHALALSRAEIESLPDTYVAAVKSGAFSDVLQTNRYNFLPRDLINTNSGWYEILPAGPLTQIGPHLPEHTLVAGGRSVFRAFVNLPADTQDTSVLSNYVVQSVQALEESERNNKVWRQFWATNTIARSNVVALMQQPEVWKEFLLTNRESVENLNPKPTRGPRQLPWGTQFLLLREMICLDENGQLIPSHVVESVQFRTIYWTGSSRDSSEREHRVAREVELSRALLFQGQQGGLRPIPAGEPRARAYNNLGHLRVDEEGNGPPQKDFPHNCAECHSGNDLFSHVAAFSTPARSATIESIARWKQESGKINLLRELMFSPMSNGK